MVNRDQFTPEEQAEIDAAIAEADLGGGVPAEEVLRELSIRRRRTDEEYIPTPEEEAELEAGFDEIERGEYVTLDEVMREVRAMRVVEERKRR